MCPSAWFRELWRNRFHISPSRLGMALIQTMVSFFNSALWVVQMVVYGRRIARTQVDDAPVFVLGHWRSGTTLLHELLVSDPRHICPDTYATFAPNHFLVSRRLLAWWLKWLIPAKRPMDEMKVGWDSPQEDEWALCSMGIPSPYLTLMFPNHPPAYEEYLDLREVPGPAIARWKQGLMWYLKCLTLQTPGRIVLKTPQHTCRVRALLEMFPNARFVHIVRDPYVVFPSTIKLWKRLYRYHGLQVPHYEGLEERVFSWFDRMYRVFEEDRHLIPEDRFCEVHYEDLARDPMGQMQAVYANLGLGSFEPVRPAIQAYMDRTRDYKVNRHELTPEARDRITQRWRGFIERYGYSLPADQS